MSWLINFDLTLTAIALMLLIGLLATALADWIRLGGWGR